MTVREMTEGDIDSVVDAYESVAAEGMWVGGELPIDREHATSVRVDRVRRGECLSLVAEVGGRIVGELGVDIVHGHGDLGMHLLSDFRGQGIGSEMMARAIDWARAQGLAKLTLEVWPHNERAIALYEKFGFVREGYHPKQWRRRSGESWDTISMGLVL
ncbi:MAG TPA: GNAT family N-acetyltransferase [Actinomycetota bacterium]|nr:GNAT family N-acetyltransferase [Actinomycetota bacterium]